MIERKGLWVLLCGQGFEIRLCGQNTRKKYVYNYVGKGLNQRLYANI
jgi:hypothetical protein